MAINGASVQTPQKKDGSVLLVRALRLLRKSERFRELHPEIQNKIAEAFRLRHFSKGQVIYLEGEPAVSVYIIETGWVKATRISREGREQTLQVLHEGEIFGDVAVFTRTTYPGTVIALEDVDLFVIPAETLLELTARYSPLAMTVIRHLSERILYYIGMVEDMALRNVEARVANTLLRNAERGDGILFVPRRSWTTFDEMAVRLGTVRDVLSRALHTLEKENLLQVKRNEIIILDPEGLKKRGDL